MSTRYRHLPRLARQGEPLGKDDSRRMTVLVVMMLRALCCVPPTLLLTLSARLLLRQPTFLLGIHAYKFRYRHFRYGRRASRPHRDRPERPSRLTNLDERGDNDMKSTTRNLLAALAALACLGSLDAAAGGHRGPDRHPGHQPPLSGEVIPVEIYDPLGLVAHGPQGQLHKLADGYGFTEGPAADRHGNVFFTDQPNDRIYRWDAGTGDITLWLQGTGRANGMIFDREGNLIAAADMHGELWKIRPDKSHQVLIDNYQGKLLNGPNDVRINRVNGGI